MQFIQGNNRSQHILFPESLDQFVDQENEVRIIDLFVDSINIADFKFVIKTTQEGRPAYCVLHRLCECLGDTANLKLTARN